MLPVILHCIFEFVTDQLITYCRVSCVSFLSSPRNAPLDDIRILLACGAKVNEPVTQGLRPLHYATYQKYTDCVNLLLVRGSDIDAMDDIGYTAIHLCAEKGYYDLLRLLLEHGARVKFTGSPVSTAGCQ